MSDKKLKKIVVILPTYNEKNNIVNIINGIISMLPAAEILVVDDNSPDGTAKIVKNLTANYSNLSLLERPLKTGLGDAYKDAIKLVLEDKSVGIIITMDADGSHQPKYLKDFLNHISSYDLIVGSRYIAGGGVEHWQLWRKLLSRLGNLYAKILIGVKISDLTAGFLCIRRKLLEKVDFNEINSQGYAYLMEFKFYCVSKLGARVKEVPIIFTERAEGKSKMSRYIIIEGIKAPLKIFLKKFFKD